MSTNFTSALGNRKIQEAYDVAVEKRLDKVSKKANDAIKSFAELVDEINRLQNDSKGTTAKKEIASIATDMSNSTVLMTKMLTAQFEALQGVIIPKTPGEEAGQETTYNTPV